MLSFGLIMTHYPPHRPPHDAFIRYFEVYDPVRWHQWQSGVLASADADSLAAQAKQERGHLETRIADSSDTNVDSELAAATKASHAADAL
jgi:hypothetical protein